MPPAVSSVTALKGYLYQLGKQRGCYIASQDSQWYFSWPQGIILQCFSNLLTPLKFIFWSDINYIVWVFSPYGAILLLDEKWLCNHKAAVWIPRDKETLAFDLTEPYSHHQKRCWCEVTIPHKSKTSSSAIARLFREEIGQIQPTQGKKGGNYTSIHIR